MGEREALSTKAMKNVPRVSTVALVLLVATYLWTLLTGGLDEPFGLVRYGANAPSLVIAGEWYRLFSANVLHINLIHIYFNGFGILVLGMVLERLIGSWRLLYLLLVTAAAGSMASAWTSRAVMSVGASTAVFGLLGALAVINWRYRDTLPGGFRQPFRWWLFVLGINALLPFVVPMIDYAAHIGGFAAGVIATSFLCRDPQLLTSPNQVSQQFKGIVVGLSIVFVFSFNEAVQSSFEPTDTYELLIARQFVTQSTTRPGALNAVAWQYAIDAEATSAYLELAEDAARIAVRQDPDNGSFIDTLATLYYRRGDIDAAVMTQQRAVGLDDRRVLVSQMGRFLNARLTESGAMSVAGADASSVRVSVSRPSDASDSEPSIVIDLPRDVENGLEIFALDKSGTRLIGIARIVIGPGIAAGTHRIEQRGRLFARPTPRNETLIVAFADASACDCSPGEIRARYFSMDPEVARFP